MNQGASEGREFLGGHDDGNKHYETKKWLAVQCWRSLFPQLMQFMLSEPLLKELWHTLFLKEPKGECFSYL